MKRSCSTTRSLTRICAAAPSTTVPWHAGVWMGDPTPFASWDLNSDVLGYSDLQRCFTGFAGHEQVGVL